MHGRRANIKHSCLLDIDIRTCLVSYTWYLGIYTERHKKKVLNFERELREIPSVKFVKLSINNHIVGLVYKHHVINEI